MRTIKFRGQHIGNREWVHGYLLFSQSGICSIRSIDDCLTYQVDPDTIGQFTGLYDYNGTPIFEGDIIQGEYDYKHLIRYDEQRAQFTATLLEYIGDKIFDKSNAGNVYQQWIDEFKKSVVGNRYDNPELLKGDKNEPN